MAQSGARYIVKYTKASTGKRHRFLRDWDNITAAKAFAREMNKPNSQGERPIKNAKAIRVKARKKGPRFR